MSVDFNLLENVEFRFALADSDDKFSIQLNTFLCAVLDKFDSTDKTVQKKVMDICQHVTKRIQSNVELKLPLPQLMSLFSLSTKRPLVLNFCVVFIETALKRSSPQVSQSK